MSDTAIKSRTAHGTAANTYQIKSGFWIAGDLLLSLLALNCWFWAQGPLRFSLSSLTSSLACVCLLWLGGTYRRHPILYLQLIEVAVAASVGFAVSTQLTRIEAAGRQHILLLLGGWVSAWLLLSLRRVMSIPFLSRQGKQERVSFVILGAADDAGRLFKHLSEKQIGSFGRSEIKVRGIFSDGIKEIAAGFSSKVVLNDFRWAGPFAERHRIQKAIVAIPAEPRQATNRLVKKSAAVFKDIYIAPFIQGSDGTTSVGVDPRRQLFVLTGDRKVPGNSHGIKRVFDLAAAAILGIAVLPFAICVALAIRLTSKGPVFFKQMRIGKGNRMFVALKFRTMYVDAAERLEHYLEKNLRFGLSGRWFTS